MTTQPITLTQPQPTRRPTFAFPLILIAIGVVFLLANAGYVNGAALVRLATLWPIALVVIGADLLLRDRSTVAVVLVEIAIIGASVAYAVAGPGALVPVGTTSTTVGRENTQSLSFVLNYGAGQLTLHGGSSELVAVRSTHEDVRVENVRRTGTSTAVTVSPTNDNVFVGPDRSWDVAVPSDIPVTLTVNVGAGDFDLALQDVQLRSARISNGASNLTVRLPKASGDVPVNISTGASSITLEMPAGAQYRVRTTGGLNTVNGTDESAGYATATDRYTIVVSAGASTITIR